MRDNIRRALPLPPPSVRRVLPLPPPTVPSELPSYDDQLYDFLHNSPFHYHYDLPIKHSVADQIITVLNERICLGTSPELIFGTSIVPGLVDGRDAAAIGASGHEDSMSVSGYLPGGTELERNSDLSPEYQESQRGKACGHVFRRGEGVYRCRNCALDETCVFCSRCFHATDHEGHDTSFSIASGHGGCCDCGDPEAWKVPLYCKYHSLHPTTSAMDLDDQPPASEAPLEHTPLPEEIVAPIRATLSTVLDFIIDTLVEAPYDLTIPESLDEIRDANPPEDRRGFLETNTPERVYPYACILWNDETHSFSDVIDQVKDAMNADEDFAKGVAETVDAHGRHPVCISEDIVELTRIGRRIARIGLAVSIRSARETFREEVAGILIAWLKNLSTKMVGARQAGNIIYEPVDALVRRLICEELCTYRRILKEKFTGRPMSEKSLAEDEEDICLVNSGPDILAMAGSDAEARRFMSHRQSGKKLRLDYLFSFDVKMWKESRNSLRELYIATMIVSGDEFKKALGIRFAHNYLRIAHAYLLHDREYDLSIINFSVQLFTVPTIARYLTDCTNLLPSLFVMLKAFYFTEVYPSKYSLKNFYDAFRKARDDVSEHYLKLKCESEATHSRRYWHIFQDIRYLVTAQRVKDDVFSINEEHLRVFLDLCRVWQGMHPQQRYTRQHVEYESETWVHAFNLSLQAGRQVKLVADCVGHTGKSDFDVAELCQAIPVVVRALDAWCRIEQAEETRRVITQQGQAAGLGVNMERRVPGTDGLHLVEVAPGKAFRLPFFSVASQPISFHYPLHWLLAHLISHIPRVMEKLPRGGENRHLLFQFFGGWHIGGQLSNMDLANVSRIMEYPLRNAVVLAQIRAGLWVRNGFSLRAQAIHYGESTLRESYDQDLLLLQVYSILVGSDMFLSAILDRFDLILWFSGRVSEAASLTGLEQSQLASLAQDLLELLITLLTETTRLIPYSPTAELRREIIHHLAAHSSGIPYSELCKKIPDRLMDAMEGSLDTVLTEVAEFRPPEGMNDVGVYALKEAFLPDVDVWFWHYTRSDREEVAGVLRKYILGEQARGQGEKVRVPRLDRIPTATGFAQLSNMVQSETFVRMLFFALWNNLGTGVGGANAGIVAGAVHLVLVAVQIDRMKAEHKVHVEGYRFMDLAAAVDIPIANEEATSLLKLLLQLFDRAREDEIKEHTSSLRWIIERIEEMGEEYTRHVILEWRRGKVAQIEAAGEGGTSSMVDTADDDRERKRQAAKAAAKARQAAIMQQFAQAQKDFMQTHGHAMEENTGMEDVEENIASSGWGVGDDPGTETVEDDATERVWKFPAGTCIFCQEAATPGSGVFGMLALVQGSDALNYMNLQKWQCGMRSLDCRTENLGSSPSMLPRASSQVSEALAGCPSSSPTVLPEPRSLGDSHIGYHISSCGHLMHRNCFEQYCKSISQRQTAQPTRNHPENLERKEYLCPLCKSLGNSLLPILWRSKKEIINHGLRAGHVDVVFGSQSWWEEKIEMWVKDLRKAKTVNSGPVVTPYTTGLFPGGDLPSTMGTHIAPNLSMLYGQLLLGTLPLAHQTWTADKINSKPQEADLPWLVELWNMLTVTIRSMDNSTRGVGPKFVTNGSGIGILDAVPDQALSLLRVLSETIFTYGSEVLKKEAGQKRLQVRVTDLLRSVFYGFVEPRVQGSSLDRRDLCDFLGSMEVENLWTEVCFGLCIGHLGERQDVFQWCGIFYVAEIVKAVLGVLEGGILAGVWIGPDRRGVGRREVPEMEDFIRWLCQLVEIKENARELALQNLDMLAVEGLVRSVTLIFLRNAVLLLWATLGIVPPNANAALVDMGEQDEFERLRKYLRLPPLSAVCSRQIIQDQFWNRLIVGWCKHLILDFPDQLSVAPASTTAHVSARRNVSGAHLANMEDEESDILGYTVLLIPDPAIPSLIPLPYRLDTLFEESLRRKCKKCHQVPSDPALCLICGRFVCSQSYCCQEGERGECNLHAKECSGSIGIYFIVKKCVIYLLYDDKGCFIPPPYLDAHGEVDIGLRRGRPQYLNQKRYDEIKKLWLTQGIPSFVARKIEQSYDVGGWQTM